MIKPIDINTLHVLAERGDDKARIQLCQELGIMSYYGRNGVKQNYEEAVKCFQIADNKNMLGGCYLHGLGVERNIEKTIEILKEFEIEFDT